MINRIGPPVKAGLSDYDEGNEPKMERQL